MFGMSWVEIMIILAVGMFVLGPERIPVAVKWVSSSLRTVRTMAAGAQEQLRGEFGPELEELRRQVADLQSLKEIQDLRKLRDLNPRAMLTKNILGEEFSGGIGGIGGFLGLNSSDANKTGSGVAAEPVDLFKVPDHSIEMAQPSESENAAPEVEVPSDGAPAGSDGALGVSDGASFTGAGAGAGAGEAGAVGGDGESTTSIDLTKSTADAVGTEQTPRASARHRAPTTFDNDAT